MRRGFTILELLVATLLLGMMATILTMIFNQSSISWRIGIAHVSDMNGVRNNMAELHEEADNAFVADSEIHRILGVWDSSGKLRTRACDAPNAQDLQDRDHSLLLKARANGLRTRNLNQIQPIPMGQSDTPTSFNNYTVNVKSGGPANDLNDWQAIWSFPDDPSEW